MQRDTGQVPAEGNTRVLLPRDGCAVSEYSWGAGGYGKPAETASCC